MTEKFSSEIDKQAIDWLKYFENKKYDKHHLMAVLVDGVQDRDFNEWLTTENEERMMNAIINGYEIEEEKYRVRFGSNYYLTKPSSPNAETLIEFWNNNEHAGQFTLVEIEAIDPRYLAFKEKVED